MRVAVARNEPLSGNTWEYWWASEYLDPPYRLHDLELPGSSGGPRSTSTHPTGCRLRSHTARDILFAWRRPVLFVQRDLDLLLLLDLDAGQFAQ